MSRTVHRLRLVAVCLGLAVLAFLQDPGRVAADTKLDLTLDPWGFLQRALHIWDDTGFFGQLQNQAYGYLWPVGPFFGVMKGVGISPWVAQRVWWSLLLIVAFLGTVRLLRLLGVDSALSRVLAGIGYALSARIVTELGPISVEAWPMALAPWLLIPLVIGSRSGSVRRWAAISGLVVLAAGGINAVATVAILPLGAVFILTRTPGVRRRRLIGWWGLSVALACAWWAAPLVILGAYSPPFLDWIEGAAVTTLGTDPASMLRGTTQWVAYLSDRAGPVWLAGWQLVHDRATVLAGFFVVALSLAGLLRRGLPERSFVTITLLVGMILTGLGHAADWPWTGLLAEQTQSAMDGPLAPLRNTHKFQPLISLPLTIALGHALGWRPNGRLRDLPGGHRLPMRLAALPARAIAMTAVAAVVGISAMPALSGALTRDRTYVGVPGYWYEAAQWLNTRDAQGRALIVPTASFGVYLWGRTQDEPFQAMRTESWGVRDAVPLSSAGNIRLLDEVERRLAAGSGSAGLAEALDRSGVRWLVVRNDLDRDRVSVTPPALVYQALENTPGVVSAATFGPTVYPSVADERTIDGGARIAVPAIEIFSVTQPDAAWDPRVVLRDASVVTTYSGAPEALVGLAEHGLLGNGPLFRQEDLPAGLRASRHVMTDTYRRAEANFGSTSNQYSETMTNEQSWRSTRRVHDYELDTLPLTSAEFDGFTVDASSAGSSPFATRARSPGAQPWAAVDGDIGTAWVSGDFSPGLGQWWSVSSDTELSLRSLRVRFVADRRVGPAPEVVRLVAGGQSVDLRVRPTGEWQRLQLDGLTKTRSIRLELRAVEGGGSGFGFGIAEIEVPGLAGHRSVSMGSGTASGGILVSARTTGREACVEIPGAHVCHPSLRQAGEERSGIRRTLELTTSGWYRVSGVFRPKPGAALNAGLTSSGPSVRASSSLVDDPAGRPQAAADGDPGTTWIADPDDRQPRLTLTWREPMTFRGLRFSLSPFAAASPPIVVELRADGVTQSVALDESGTASLTVRDVSAMEIRFTSTQRRFVQDPVSGSSVPLPLGVTEVGVVGASRAPAPEDELLTWGCGTTPSLRVGSQSLTMEAVSSTSAVLAGQPFTGRGCADAVWLTSGSHTLVAEPTADLLVDSVALVPAGQPSASGARAESLTVAGWTPTSRELVVPSSSTDRTLELAENYNAGWRARMGGSELEPVKVDGWRQAFLVPPGPGGAVTVWFAPDRVYRAGLSIGAVAALVLVLLGVRGSRTRAPAPLSARAAPRTALLLVVVAAALSGGWLGLAVSGLGIGLVRISEAVAEGGGLRIGAWTTMLSVGALAVGMAVLPWPERLGHQEAHTALATGLPLIAVACACAVGAFDREDSKPSTSG